MPKKLYESNDIDVPLLSGQWTGLAFAGANPAVIHAGPAAVEHVLVHLVMAADTPADATVDGRYYLTDTDGQNPSAYAVISHQGGGGHQFHHTADVPTGKHLRFEVRAKTFDESPTVLLHRVMSSQYRTP